MTTIYEPATGQTTTYTYDGEDRLVQVLKAGVTYTLTYDGLSRMRKLQTGGTTKTFMWLGSKMAEERDATGATVVKQFFGQGVRDSGVNKFYTFDHLGSIRELVAVGGNTVLARYEYDPYGRRTRTAGTQDADFGFTGHSYHAPTGLHLALYRAYDADLGRWLNRDPIQEEGGINLYAYVGNNPISFVDPYGLFQTGMFFRGAVGAVVSGVGAVVGYAAATTGVGTIPGGALGIYSSYQFGANVGNMINAFGDGPAGPSGPAEAVVTVATDNQNAQNCAKVADLAIPLALSFGASPQWSRLPTTALGRPGTIAGAVQRVPGDPNVVYPFLQAFQYAAAALTVYEGWNWVGPTSTTQVNAPPAQVVGPRP